MALKVVSAGVLVEKKVSRAATNSKAGFNLYTAEIKDRIADELITNLKKGTQLKPRVLTSELGKRWKNLPESTRNIWNAKASH
jgi:hypothetical protein